MRFFILLATLFVSNIINAQPDWLFIDDDKDAYKGPEWVKSSKLALDINEAVFVNWNEGGTNSISGVFDAKSSIDYSDGYYVWINNAHLRFGLNNQDGKGTSKTDDLFEVNSNLGYKPNENSNWYYMARLNFRTQLAKGYNDPDGDPISRFMAPGYLFFGVGMEYGKKIEKFSFYFSPLTIKTTFVLDQELANLGAFGVKRAVYDDQGNLLTPGEQIRKEIGVLLTVNHKMDLAENIVMKNQLSLYSDYIDNFGNMDVDWRLELDFKVNNYVRANFGSHLRYDEDIKTLTPTDVSGVFEETSAKVQWKQALGVGVTFEF